LGIPEPEAAALSILESLKDSGHPNSISLEEFLTVSKGKKLAKLAKISE